MRSLSIAPPSCRFSVSQKYLMEFSFKEGKFKLANSQREFSAEVSCELEVRQNAIAAEAHSRGSCGLSAAKKQRPKTGSLKAPPVPPASLSLCLHPWINSEPLGFNHLYWPSLQDMAYLMHHNVSFPVFKEATSVFAHWGNIKVYKVWLHSYLVLSLVLKALFVTTTWHWIMRPSAGEGK